MTTSQNSSDLVSYAIFEASLKHQQPNNEKSQHTEKIGSENLTLEDDHAQEIASRIQNTGIAHFEMDFKTLIKKLRDREKIVTQRHDK
jgi:transaldolase